MKAVLCLGANLGDRGRAIENATRSLDRLALTRVTRRSSIIETKPEGVPDEQPDYLNRVCEVETGLSPEALLGACFGIEAAAGRVRVGIKSARTLDIDLLLYEGIVRADELLTLPHPRMLERYFVLKPLSEIYPEGSALGVEFGASLCRMESEATE